MQKFKRYLYKIFSWPIKSVFSSRTISLIVFDIIRFKSRFKRLNDKKVIPSQNRLHLGCGAKRVQGWLNVDVVGSDYDVDLGGERLPWGDEVFEAIVSQHFIEHIELTKELLPLLSELHRVLRSGKEIWLSCPDIEKICRSYNEHKMLDLLEDRKSRFPDWSLGDIPTSHMINHLFHQGGEHKNLYDFALLSWALEKSDFCNVKQVTHVDFLSRFPEFPPREDDLQSIYVKAIA